MINLTDLAPTAIYSYQRPLSARFQLRNCRLQPSTSKACRQLALRRVAYPNPDRPHHKHPPCRYAFKMPTTNQPNCQRSAFAVRAQGLAGEPSNLRLNLVSVNGKFEVFKKPFSAGVASVSHLTFTHLRAKNHLDFSLGRKPN